MLILYSKYNNIIYTSLQNAFDAKESKIKWNDRHHL